MESKVTRTEGFYKFLALTGLLLAVGSGGIGSWSVHRTQETAFTLQTDVASLTADATRQAAAATVAQDNLTRLNNRLAASPNRATPYYASLTAEVARARTQAELLQLEVKAKSDVATVKSQQIGMLEAQRLQELKLTAILSGTGLVFTIVGLLFWYWRVQRYLEIEGHARMTTMLVEEIVAQSKAEAARAREELVDELSSMDEAVAVVTAPLSGTRARARRAS